MFLLKRISFYHQKPERGMGVQVRASFGMGLLVGRKRRSPAYRLRIIILGQVAFFPFILILSSLFLILFFAGRGPPRELILSAQAPLILENRLVCKFEFRMEFSLQGMEPDDESAGGKGKEKERPKLTTIRGVVGKGENFEVFSIPLVEVNKRAPRAKLFVKLKGYRWSDPVEIVMPTMDEQVHLSSLSLFSLCLLFLFFFIVNSLWQLIPKMCFFCRETPKTTTLLSQ